MGYQKVFTGEKKKHKKEPARQKRGAEAASGCKAGVFDHAG